MYHYVTWTYLTQYTYMPSPLSHVPIPVFTWVRRQLFFFCFISLCITHSHLTVLIPLTTLRWVTISFAVCYINSLRFIVSKLEPAVTRCTACMYIHMNVPSTSAALETAQRMNYVYPKGWKSPGIQWLPLRLSTHIYIRQQARYLSYPWFNLVQLWSSRTPPNLQTSKLGKFPLVSSVLSPLVPLHLFL